MYKSKKCYSESITVVISKELVIVEIQPISELHKTKQKLVQGEHEIM